MKQIEIKRLSDGAVIPEYASLGAAAADICADCPNGMVLLAGERILVGTGIALAIPTGYVGLVFARSGLASKHGISLSNSVGVIDSDYRGELKIALCNNSNKEYRITHNERIAQLAIMPVEMGRFVETSTLTDTERGDGGFGSTGKV